MPEQEVFGTILVGTDGSPAAGGAVRRAADLAALCGARLVLVSAYKSSKASMLSAVAPTPDAQGSVDDQRSSVEAMLEKTASELRGRGLSVETVAVAGSAAPAILDVAETNGADLIVVGNKGMGGARRYLGSVPNSVAHGADCAVMIVRTG